MSDELKDVWIPENTAAQNASEPLIEREWAGSQVKYVRVRLADVDRTLEWRTVEAESLSEAVKIAEAMPDVEVCLEASFIPGGAVT